MKKLKRILSTVLAVALLVFSASLAGCGDASSDAYNIPIVCGETGMNEACGIATYGVNYYNLGVKAGDMAADILLNGADVSTMAVATDPSPALSVNTAIAETIGFTIPDEILALGSGDDSTLSVTRVDSAIVDGDADFTVGILQLVQHVALDQSNVGFQDQLSVRMAAAGKTVKILDRNAANDQANNITIAETFVSQNVDLMYAIATSSAQACAAASEESKIPVLFCAVTDPVSAGLVEAMDIPGGNVSGVSDINPVADQIDLIASLIGRDDVKIGLLYTSAETNSVFQVGLAKAECESKGYTYIEKGIGDINDIQAAFVALAASGVDAIYVPTDNVLANGAATIHSVNIGG